MDGERKRRRGKMKLGIGLPNTLAHETDRRLMLDWARLADEAGFDLLATIDKPNFDSWDPLVTLAGVAGVTSRARLATTILQLPNRNEVLVAKQAAVVDQLSGGRLVLGVAQGGARTISTCSARSSATVLSGSRRRCAGFARSGRGRTSRIATRACSDPRRCRNRARPSGRAPCRRKGWRERFGSETASSSRRREARRWRR